MKYSLHSLFFLFFSFAGVDCSPFLSFSKSELCRAEPHLSMCQNKALSAKSSSSQGLTASRLEQLAKKDGKQGFMEQEATDDQEDPFAEIATRAPPSAKKRRRHYHSLDEYYRAKQSEYYHEQQNKQQSGLYTLYPSFHPKDQSYCSDMQPNFAFTCQPSKPLRVDLVEFCKDYAAMCGVPNMHQLPGPRMGPPPDTRPGRIGVSGKFGLGIGAVPGMEVGVGWGVDVGPIPGMTENVGVDLGLDLGLLGSKSPEAYRRGMGPGRDPNGGVFGISGGVGVKAPGSGPIGVGSGLGVGK